MYCKIHYFLIFHIYQTVSHIYSLKYFSQYFISTFHHPDNIHVIFHFLFNIIRYFRKRMQKIR